MVEPNFVLAMEGLNRKLAGHQKRNPVPEKRVAGLRVAIECMRLIKENNYDGLIIAQVKGEAK